MGAKERPRPGFTAESDHCHLTKHMGRKGRPMLRRTLSVHSDASLAADSDKGNTSATSQHRVARCRSLMRPPRSEWARQDSASTGWDEASVDQSRTPPGDKLSVITVSLFSRSVVSDS